LEQWASIAAIKKNFEKISAKVLAASYFRGRAGAGRTLAELAEIICNQKAHL
jgi:hypothetical protein